MSDRTVAPNCSTDLIGGLSMFCFAKLCCISSVCRILLISSFMRRTMGAGTAAALLASSAQGSNRFRTGFGIDQLVAAASPDGRTTQRLVVAWIVIVLLVAAALWLDPDPFPFPHP